MRILVLLTDAFGGRGGIAKFNRDFLTALCSYPEAEEVVAIPRLMPDAPEPFPAKLTYVIKGLNSKWKYFLTAINTILKNPKFDFVICSHINLLPLAALVKMFFIRKPMGMILYGIDSWNPARRWLIKLFLKHIVFLISISEFTKNKFNAWAKLERVRTFILPPAVDLDRFTPGPKKPDLLRRYGLEGKKVIMTLSRLQADERYKGIDEVLEAMPTLLKEIPNLAYLIVGDGTDKKRLEEKSKILKLNGQVIFTGRISESEKCDYYRLADVFVMPGWGEGFGIVFLEAMACGIPVIASKKDGSREALKNGKLGILVHPKGSQEIKNGIYLALKRSRGLAPVELTDFSIEGFQCSVHSVVDNSIGKKY